MPIQITALAVIPENAEHAFNKTARHTTLLPIPLFRHYSNGRGRQYRAGQSATRHRQATGKHQQNSFWSRNILARKPPFAPPGATPRNFQLPGHRLPTLP